MTQRTLYLDTETTGLDPRTSGVVEIAIVDDAGEVLLQSLVNPWPHKAWPEAEAIHGITPEMVKHAPLIHDLWPAIFKMVQGSRLVIYNAEYDRQFFPNGALMYCDIECAMLRYSRAAGVMGPRGTPKWHKLVDAASDCEHEWNGKAHRAVADAQACRTVWRYLEAEEAENKKNVPRGTVPNYAEAR